MSIDKINNEELVRTKKWNSEIVNRILRNEIYLGTLIQNIKTKPNYRTNKLIDENKDDWIVTKNHYESIVSKEIFNKAQNILNKKKGYFKSKDVFSEYLKCSDCGKSMILRKSKDKEYYYCSKFIRNHSCTNHSIRKDKLEELLLKDIKEKNSNIKSDIIKEKLLYMIKII